MTRRRIAGAVAAALLLSGCVPASPDADTFEDEAMRTAGAAVSEVRTVERLLVLLREQRILRPTAVTQLRYSEDGLGTAADDFTELNPPLSRDRLADRLSTLLDRAEQQVAEARVAVERRDVQAYRDLAHQLETTAKHLERVEARTS